MKKYKFLVKKTKEIEIDICAENHSKAMLDLLQEIAKQDKNFFSESSKDKKDLYIKIKKIVNEKGKENLKDYDDFIKENNFFISKFVDDCIDDNEKDFEENEDDLLAEYDEIVCENCGNCIRVDKNLLS